MRRVLLVVGTTLAFLLAAMPATAEPHAVGGSAAGVLAFPVVCFGYWGEFKAGTTVKRHTWSNGNQECFGIAPNRTIWHAWPNSGGWREMPGNGRADRVRDVWEAVPGHREVQVEVTTGGYPYWCNANPAGSASWGRWRACSA